MLRFLDGEQYFAPDSLSALLFGVQAGSPTLRQVYFDSIVSCRRRSSMHWKDTPLAHVFRLPTAFDLLRRWTLSAAMAAALKQRALMPHQAFDKVDPEQVIFENVHFF